MPVVELTSVPDNFRIRLAVIGPDGAVLDEVELVPRAVSPSPARPRARRKLALGIGAAVLVTALLGLAHRGSAPRAHPEEASDESPAPTEGAGGWQATSRKLANEVAVDGRTVTLTAKGEDHPQACLPVAAQAGASVALQGRWQATLPEGADARVVVKVTRAGEEKARTMTLAELQRDAPWTPLGGALALPADTTAVALCLLARGDGAVLSAEGVRLE